MPTAEKHGPGEAPREVYSVEEIQVAEWCPTPDSSGPPEQVVMLIRVTGLAVPIALRMTTGAAVDAIVDALVEHRVGVFGPRTTGGA